MNTYISASVEQTEQYGEALARDLKAGDVVAMFGDMGMGKTQLVHGIARGLGLNAAVSSPTFAIVHDYGGNPPLVHFDMYRVSGWDDLYSTGFFDYLESGAILAVEWSENIENALPETAIRLYITKIDDQTRQIERK
ncbi:MAG: tRNA (adenosine(37)-N6)-threonylcarbamoyltransferase complex ATPase subunit type 1 TsaE [Clostridia bacterium]|nr:tRNA (adenosine(37)-N6)-threonylcarbamoyltransferase complex ATPase subunit type 1 TsaE [Clostridia bacterium]